MVVVVVAVVSVFVACCGLEGVVRGVGLRCWCGGAGGGGDGACGVVLLSTIENAGVQPAPSSQQLWRSVQGPGGGGGWRLLQWWYRVVVMVWVVVVVRWWLVGVGGVWVVVVVMGPTGACMPVSITEQLCPPAMQTLSACLMHPGWRRWRWWGWWCGCGGGGVVTVVAGGGGGGGGVVDGPVHAGGKAHPSGKALPPLNLKPELYTACLDGGGCGRVGWWSWWWCWLWSTASAVCP